MGSGAGCLRPQEGKCWQKEEQNEEAN